MQMKNILNKNRTMKLSFLLFALVLFNSHANSYGQNKKISLDVENESVENVLERIETKSKFNFFYKTGEIDVQRKISLKVVDTSIDEILELLFKGKNVSHTLVKKQIVLKRIPAQKTTVTNKVEVQNNPVVQRSVSGTVSDTDGNPLPGASIVEEGTTNGTQTDFDGNFSIELSDESTTLVISYIGFATQEVSVVGQNQIAITLRESAAGLEEVIVTGYTAQSRRLVTGAVETIKEDELSKNPATSIDQQLQGKISGVNIVTSGNPSGTANVRVRGFATLGTARNPLYIIDGAPSESLDGINPDDIETISVLKDASAASIYGARAANGVVVVSTKKGSYNQKTSITYSTFSGVDIDPGKVDVLNAQQWGEVEFQGQIAAVRGTAAEATFVPANASYGTGTPVIPEFINGDPSLPYDADTNRLMRSADTDWYDVLTRAAFVQNHNLSMLGGSESSRYGVSFGFLDRDGTLIENDFQRYSTRVNTEFSALNKRLRFGENISVSYSENNGNRSAGVLRQRYHPLIPRFDEGGNFGGTLSGILELGTNAVNPEANQVRNANRIDRTWRIFGNAYVEADILPDLTLKSNVGIDYTQNNNSAFSPNNPEGGNPGNSLSENTSFSTSVTWTNTLNYRKRIEDHSFDLLLGTEAIAVKNKFISFSGTDFFSEDLDFVSISTSGTTNNILGFQANRNLASVFGKIDYNFKNKYLLNATVRRDGSSALGENNRFDIFPAFGVGWVISEENFLSESSAIDILKLRAGWGRVGNQNVLDEFDFVSLFSQDATFRSTGIDITASNSGDPANGIALLARGNPDLLWETSTTLNIGLDYALFGNKITGAVEWYDRRTTDLLQRLAVPLASGSAEAPFVNLGEIKNTGLDLSLTYNNSSSEDFSYSVTGIVSTYTNEVVDIDGNPNSFFDGPGGNPNITAARTVVGGEVAAFYGLIVDGVLQQDTDRNNDGVIAVSERAGNFNFRDLNDDGEINLEDDRDFIGSPHADFTYSLNFSGNYKNWDFSIFLRGSQGNDIYAYDRIFSDFQAFAGLNRSTRVLDAWSPDNPSNTLAEFSAATADLSLQGSSYFVQDGSYLRLQTLQIGYTFPDLFGLDGFRVYLQGQNIYTITGYDGIDPEIGENGGLEIGVDRGTTYPVPRTFLLGFKLSL